MRNVGEFLKNYPSFSFNVGESIQSFSLKSVLRERLDRYVYSLSHSSLAGTENLAIEKLRDCAAFVPAYNSLSDIKSIADVPLVSKSQILTKPFLFCDFINFSTCWKKTSTGTTSAPLDTYSDIEFHFDELFLTLKKIAVSRRIATGERDIFSVTLFPSGCYPAFVLPDPLEQNGLSIRVTIDERNPPDVLKVMDFLIATKPELIVSKSPLFEAIIKYAAPERLREINAKLVVNSGCSLDEKLRSRLTQIFGCPVTNAYASSEFGLIATECPSEQGLHIDLTAVFPEIINKKTVSETARGEIVLSSLKNKAMPLFRYQTGDFAVLTESSCECGIKTPRFLSLVGKRQPCIWTTENIGLDPSRLNPVIYRNPKIKSYRIVQKTKKLVEITIYPKIKRSFDRADCEKLKTEIKTICPPKLDIAISVEGEPDKQRISPPKKMLLQ